MFCDGLEHTLYCSNFLEVNRLVNLDVYGENHKSLYTQNVVISCCLLKRTFKKPKPKRTSFP